MHGAFGYLSEYLRKSYPAVYFHSLKISTFNLLHLPGHKLCPVSIFHEAFADTPFCFIVILLPFVLLAIFSLRPGI
jgi:hypothetical protein